MKRRAVLSSWLLLLVLAPLQACERKRDVPDPFNTPAEPQAQAVATQAPAPVPALPEALPLEPPFGPLRAPKAGLPCAVDTVFADKCRRCHTTPTRHGAPFPLLTWQQATQRYHGEPLTRVMGAVVRSGFMPYQVETNPPVQPLTEAEKKTLLDWIEAGAPRGECESSVEPNAPAPTRKSP